jgi:hypothetical protein
MQVEHTKLTKEIRTALGVPRAAVAVVMDSEGNVTVFESSEVAKDATYPIPAKNVWKPYVCTFQAFEGSRCVDYIDSLGFARRFCFP